MTPQQRKMANFLSRVNAQSSFIYSIITSETILCLSHQFSLEKEWKVSYKTNRQIQINCTRATFCGQQFKQKKGNVQLKSNHTPEQQSSSIVFPLFQLAVKKNIQNKMVITALLSQKNRICCRKLGYFSPGTEKQFESLLLALKT